MMYAAHHMSRCVLVVLGGVFAADCAVTPNDQRNDAARSDAQIFDTTTSSRADAVVEAGKLDAKLLSDAADASIGATHPLSGIGNPIRIDLDGFSFV